MRKGGVRVTLVTIPHVPASEGNVMTKAAHSPRWFSAWRPAARPAQDDPADLGTAFGLDMSLIEGAAEPAPPPEPRPRGWAERLGWGRRDAAA